MDDIVARPRYQRRSVPSRKRKRSVRESNTFLENFMRQLLVAIIILGLVGAVKYVNTPVTVFLNDKIKSILSQDIQLKEVYTKANDFLDNILNDGAKKTEKDDSSVVTGGNETVGNGATDNEADENTGLAENMGENAADEESSVAENNNTDLQQDEDTIKIVNSIKKKYSFTVPVKGTVTSPFGDRIHPVSKTEDFHSGVDIEAEKGVPIKAALAGKVIEAGNSTTYGKYVKIEHEDGIITLYGHCSELLVKKDQKVDKGKSVAKVGNTGISVGTHLHFEVWKDGKPLDPLNFIKVSD